LLFSRRKKSENGRMFVDLEDYMEDTGIDDRGIVMKTLDMRQFSDLTAVADMVSRNWMVLIETSMFEEGETKRRDAVEKMRTVAEDRGGRFYEISDRVVLIAPLNVKVERCRIRRKT